MDTKSTPPDKVTKDGTWTPPKGSIISSLIGSVKQQDSTQSEDERRESVIREKHFQCWGLTT
jgi:hypothetical protein